MALEMYPMSSNHFIKQTEALPEKLRNRDAIGTKEIIFLAD
jgi:hypothetical protein